MQILFAKSDEKSYLYADFLSIFPLLMNGEKKYYRHFKGGKYILLAEGMDSESLIPMVIYQALFGEQKIWVRPSEMFYDTVVKDGVRVLRFKEITEEEAYGKD